MDLLEVKQGYDRGAKGYDGRHRKSAKRFARVESTLAALLANGPVLDLGCGTGRLLEQCGNPRAIGLDLSHGMLRECSEKLAGAGSRVVQGDAHSLPFADASFRAVVMAQAVIRYTEAERVFAEIRRVLAPGGICGVHQYMNALSLKGLLRRQPISKNPLSLARADELDPAAQNAGLRPLRRECWRGIPVAPHAVQVPNWIPLPVANQVVVFFEKGPA